MSEELPIVLTIEGQAGPATVVSVRGREELGRPFVYVVTFVCADVDCDAARNTLATLDIEGLRFVSGIVRSIRADVLPVERAGDLTRYSAVLVPNAWIRLAWRRGFYIFQDLNVVDIAKKVFQAAGVPDDHVDWGGVTGTYPVRTFTVQYDESEWDFLSRLFEEEGIYYAFEHDAAGHRMLMLDANAGATQLEPASLEHLATDMLLSSAEGVWGWQERARIRESKVTLRDYDFERPAVDLTVEASSTDVIEREHYAYPGYYTQASEGTRLAQVRLDAFRSEHLTARCATNVLSVMPAKRFELTGHELASGERLVTAVGIDLVLHSAEGDVHRARRDVVVYSQPFDQTFRSPRRTPKPSVVGIQTAMIAGPPGEEIHVDRYGRVKVQFHWDRQGVGDDKASCWMRVTQGHTTGSIMIPRIGWEVLVEFVDGDPDRPLVLGRLWNPSTTPPHPLPGSKTMTVHASVSSPGRGGTNEIAMDDAAGSEKITVNAQHNFVMAVANDRMLSVGKNLAATVTANRTASIGGNETRAIKGNEGDSVTGDHTIDVGGMRAVKVTGSTTEEVTGAMSFTTGLENVQVGSPAAAVLQVIQDAAIEAAVGAAASAASRAEAAMMGPIMPALGAARSALGPAAQLAGPSAALFGASPQIQQVSQAAGALSNAAGAAASGSLATGFATAAVSGALSEALGRSGGGGGGGGPTGAAGGTAGGSGTWGFTVNGAVTETIGGLAAYNSAKGISINIGGSNKETVGGARIELIKGGKSETTGAAKVETVAVYMVKAAKSYGVSAQAAVALNIAGGQSNDIGGGHSIAAKGPVLVTTPSAKLKASGKITLACGACKVIVSSGGIQIEGASEVKIEGSTIQLPETSLGT